jgi:hypothetical protein
VENEFAWKVDFKTKREQAEAAAQPHWQRAEDLNNQAATTAFVQAVNSSSTGSAATAVKLTTARTINGVSFDGSTNITTTQWGTARDVTIGATTKSVDGSVHVDWTLPEIGAEPTLAAGTTGQYYRGDKTWQPLNSAAVGLDNVDNTSDVDKPISTATLAALDDKAPLTGEGTSGIWPISAVGPNTRAPWAYLQGVPSSISTLDVKQELVGNTIDAAMACLFTKTITSATSFSVTNVAPSGTITAFSLLLTAGGSATVTWWPGIKWATGSPPVLSTTQRDLLGFLTFDGVNWIGFVRASGLAI